MIDYYTGLLLSNEIITYTSLERAVFFLFGSQIGVVLMDVLRKDYGILVEQTLIEATYVEEALSELIGYAGKLIVQKAREMV